MTLTELRYIVAVARERHFGRAAEICFVSQPTLSVAVKKLEEELGVALFERSSGDVAPTPVGARIVEQAQRVLEQAQAIREIAKAGKDPLSPRKTAGVFPCLFICDFYHFVINLCVKHVGDKTRPHSLNFVRSGLPPG